MNADVEKKIQTLGLNQGKYKDFLPQPQPDKIDYSKGIPVARDVETQELVRIEFTGTTRVLKAAGTGGGKTVMGKGEISRLYDMDYNIFHASDSKNDMRTLDNKPGASKELIESTEGLARGEERHPVPVEMFAPKFLYDLYTELNSQRTTKPSFLTPFTLPFGIVSRDDFKYLMHPDSQTQRELVGELVDSVSDWQNTGFSELWRIANELDNDTIKRKLSRVQEKGVVGGRTVRNPLESLDYSVVALSVQYMDELQDDFGKRPLYLMIAALLRWWGQQGLSGNMAQPSLLFLDECQEIIPAGRDSQVKPVLQKIMDQWARQMGMSVILSTQEPSKVSNTDSGDEYNFLGKCNHLFLSPDLDEEDWKKTLKSATNLYNPNRLQGWRDLFNRAQRYSYPFVYIDTEEHFSVDDVRIVRSLAPLVSHPKSDS